MKSLDEGERIALVALEHARVVVDLDAPCRARAMRMLRRQADERVAAEALAADDRFEQERVARVGELEVERQRRVEVGERLERRAGCGCSLARRARGIRLRSWRFDRVSALATRLRGAAERRFVGARDAGARTDQRAPAAPDVRAPPRRAAARQVAVAEGRSSCEVRRARSTRGRDRRPRASEANYTIGVEILHRLALVVAIGQRPPPGSPRRAPRPRR